MKKIIYILIILISQHLYAQETGSIEMYQVYINLALDAEEYENYESALSWYQKSLDYAISHWGENDVLVASSLSSIGSIKIHLGKIEEGICDLKESVRIGRLPQNYEPSVIVGLSSSLANGYANSKQYDTALETYKIVLKELDKYENGVALDTSSVYYLTFYQTSTLHEIAKMYYSMHQYVNAIDYYQESATVAKVFLPEDLSDLIEHRILRWQNNSAGRGDDIDQIYVLYELSIRGLFDSHIELCKQHFNNEKYKKAIFHYDYRSYADLRGNCTRPSGQDPSL